MVKLNIVKSFFKNRKRVILDRNNTSEYLVRYYLFIKDRKSFPFNITLHKIEKIIEEKKSKISHKVQ